MKVKELYKIDMMAFNSQIGYITNLGTTLYEMQSRYEIGSPEYEEINHRLKLCCASQSAVIDAAKGIKVRPFPKHWTTFQKILETDTPEEIARKEFENKLIIDKRPAFMKHLYSHYARDYKVFRDDFDLYSQANFGKKYSELTEEEKNTDKGKELVEYYDKKNPLLETNGVMNRLSRHMQEELKDIKKTKKNCDNVKIFESLYNQEIELDNTKLELLEGKKKEYEDFKKSKQLKTSDFTTYEQYYKYLRNDCLEKISSDIKELANLAVYICYFLNPNKPKDFCWDIFGAGIVGNLELKHTTVKVPHLCETGDIEYLGERYEMVEIDLNAQNSISNIDYEHLFDDVDDMFDDDLFKDLE